MDEVELKRLRDIRSLYRHSQCICDPIEYINRQKTLLISLAEYILEPLEEYEDRVENSKSTSDEDTHQP